MLQLALSEASASIPSEITPLTDQEKVRLRTLIRTIERGLSTFLEVGAALLEIRGSRLYRETHSTFESFCRDTFGLARSTCDGMIRSASVAQSLQQNGVELSPAITESVIRPVASLPSSELQSATWKLVEAASPKCGPTQPVASKVCRVIKNALESGGTNDNGHKPRSRSHPSRERPFVQSAQRLSAYKGFDAGIVTAHVEKLPSARSVYTACSNLIERCKLVQERLIERFPELEKSHA
jgi:hypothetical protein